MDISRRTLLKGIFVAGVAGAFPSLVLSTRKVPRHFYGPKEYHERYSIEFMGYVCMLHWMHEETIYQFALLIDTEHCTTTSGREAIVREAFRRRYT
jgi:hypothetical protein